MKPLLFTILIAISFLGVSQNSNVDTIYMRDGKVYYGKFVQEAITDYKVILSGEKTVTSFFKYDVRKIVYGTGKVYWDADKVYSPNEQIEQKNLSDSISVGKNEIVVKEYVVNNENLLERFKELNNRTQQSGIYLQKAGKWGISASVLFLSGTAMALAGAFTGTAELSYVGAGIGGIGLIITIPSFVNVKKAGVVLWQRNNN